jgi:hypothetical protein
MCTRRCWCNRAHVHCKKKYLGFNFTRIKLIDKLLLNFFCKSGITWVVFFNYVWMKKKTKLSCNLTLQLSIRFASSVSTYPVTTVAPHRSRPFVIFIYEVLIELKWKRMFRSGLQTAIRLSSISILFTIACRPWILLSNHKLVFITFFVLACAYRTQPRPGKY